MRFSLTEFNERYEAGRLHLAFVGMSNIGKSYTASRLSKTHEFQLIEVDALIREKLDHGSMSDFAKWQGQPYTKGYEERESVSIALETQATKQAMQEFDCNCILDTTGSVIYINESTLTQLKTQFLVVHIAAGKGDLERLKRDYFALPKPLVWRGYYEKRQGVSDEDSIIACYPKLLNSRQIAYEALEDVRLKSSFVLNPKTSMGDVFSAIQDSLS